MGRKVDPKDEQYASRDRAGKATPGDKTLAAVGFERYNSRTGSRCMSVRLMVLQGNGDEKGEVFENFVLEDNSMWRFVNFVEALGWSEPFDPDDDDDIGKILAHSYVGATIEMDTYNGKTSPRVSNFYVASGYTQDPDWPSWIEEGQDRHQGYMEWRASNPRGSGGGGGGNRSSSGGGGHRGGAAPQDDSDIPF